MEFNGDTPFLHAMQYTSVKLFSMVLKTALELDVFGIISRAGHNASLSAIEIASNIPQSNPNTHFAFERMLRMLTSHGFLNSSKRNKEGTIAHELAYGLAPSSYFLFKESNQGSLAYLHALINDKFVEDFWDRMKVALFEGSNQRKMHNETTLYDCMQNNTLLNETFVLAMSGMSTFGMRDILDSYHGFENHTTIVDVGGCTGESISMIVSKYPSVKGINYDLPHVIKLARSHPGVEHIAGNMFESVPKAEAILLKDVLHNWSDEECVKILKNCCKALPNGGKLIIITLLLPDVPDSTIASQCIANVHYFMMMMHFPGRERTKEEYLDLCKSSGFAKCEVVYVALGIWTVLEFLKA